MSKITIRGAQEVVIEESETKEEQATLTRRAFALFVAVFKKFYNDIFPVR